MQKTINYHEMPYQLDANLLWTLDLSAYCTNHNIKKIQAELLNIYHYKYSAQQIKAEAKYARSLGKIILFNIVVREVVPVEIFNG